jgi:hypothetical protein
VFVGPDNGVLALAALEDGVEEVRVIENRALTLPRVSRTFHGRDVFAPVAAHLARGVPLAAVGPLVRDGFNVPEFAEPKVHGRALECEVIYIDDFGNVARAPGFGVAPSHLARVRAALPSSRPDRPASGLQPRQLRLRRLLARAGERARPLNPILSFSSFCWHGDKTVLSARGCALKPSARQLLQNILYSVPAYSLSFSLTFRLEKITFRLLNIEFIKPRFALSP